MDNNYHKIIGLILGLLLCFFRIYLDKQKPQKKPRTHSHQVQTNLKEIDKKLKNVSGIDYAFYEIYPDLQKFLKRDSEFKEIYSDNIKIVSFCYDDSCPYRRPFNKSVKNLKNNKDYKDYYYFRFKEPQNISFPSDVVKFETLKDFMFAKGTFSIFNPEKNQVFTILDISVDKADQIKNILDELIDW